MIALTYDAGSGADGAAAILDMLKRHHLHSTFFLTGKWAETYPDLAKRIAAEGHEIANHTYSHPDLTQLPPDEVIKQIADGEAAIQRITGVNPRPLFREPYGAFNEAERRLVRQAGYSYSIYWDVDTLDWQFPPLETELKKLTEKTRGGSIVLMHLNVPQSAVASDQAIPILQEKGYQLVTVSQLLQCSP
jgi:peptidoglycan/xylan/chitin deacetylase (PgdA/CDA1 family)